MSYPLQLSSTAPSVTANSPISSTPPTPTAGIQVDHGQPLTLPGPPPHILLIDRLVQCHRLTAQHKNDLIGLYQICIQRPAALSHCDVMGQVYSLGCQYGSEQRIVERIQALENQTGLEGDFRGLLKELSSRLEDAWVITPEQKANIRALCQQQIHIPSRTSFKSLHLDVNAVIIAKPAEYRMENIIGRPNRETQLKAVVKEVSSGVRNALRQDLEKSLFGKKQCTVDQFVADQAGCYHLSRGRDASQAQLIQCVLLRRFSQDHAFLFKTAPEFEDVQKPTLDQENVRIGDEPAAKKRKQESGRGLGRVADGVDFWSRVDEWFKEKINTWGKQYGGLEWAAFIDESTKQDNEIMNQKKSKPGRPQTMENNNTSETSSDDIAVSLGGSGSGNGWGSSVGDSWLDDLNSFSLSLTQSD